MRRAGRAAALRHRPEAMPERSVQFLGCNFHGARRNDRAEWHAVTHAPCAGVNASVQFLQAMHAMASASSAHASALASIIRASHVSTQFR